MRQLRQILKLKYHTGLTHREIAKACSIGAGTVSTYVARAREAGLTWPLPPELDDATLDKQLFKLAQVAGAARPLPEWAAIHRELKRTGVTLHLLWVEYRETHPEGYAYSQFCDLYRRWRRHLSPSMRQRHRPGEKVFLDFSGKRPHLVDRDTGELRNCDITNPILRQTPTATAAGQTKAPPSIALGRAHAAGRLAAQLSHGVCSLAFPIAGPCRPSARGL